jgi:acyl-coenzyme A thioesterase 13
MAETAIKQPSASPLEQRAGGGHEATLAHVQKHWASIESNSPVYGFFFPRISIVSAVQGSGRVVARLPLEKQHINSKGILHGSVSATLVDWAGGMSIAAAKGLDRTGVSVDIHVSYVGAAREGETLEIESWVSKVGRNLAFTQVEIRKAGPAAGEKGPVVATGSHTKYLNV